MIAANGPSGLAYAANAWGLFSESERVDRRWRRLDTMASEEASYQRAMVVVAHADLSLIHI